MTWVSTRAAAAWMIITVLFGGLGERQFHGAAVGVVPLTHSALVLLFVRADLLVAAHML